MASSAAMMTRMLSRQSWALPLTVAFVACAARDTAPPVAVTPDSEAAPVESTEEPPNPLAQEVVNNLDLKADPCSDFYRFSCGGWLDANDIPSDQVRWGRFNVLRERNKEILRGILEQPSSTQSHAFLAKASTFYQTCMNEEQVETAGIEPLKPALAAIEGIRTRKDLMNVLGELHQVDGGGFFHLWAGADYKDPNLEIAHVYQGGLGLPDRDYYLKDDEGTAKLRTAYQAHVATMLQLAGEAEAAAQKHAAAILAFETRLAKASMPRDELRNPEKRYNKLDRAGLAKTAPRLPWDAYFTAVGHPDIRDINVAPPSFFAGLDKAVAATDTKTLQAYLRWQTLHASAKQLSSPFVQADFAFYGQVLSGQKELEPRWKRCVSATDQAVGEQLGRAFVEAEFAGDSKDVAIAMIRGIEQAFEAALGELAWMDAGTRTRAIEKMHAVTNKIGYPDQWRDYSALEITADSYFHSAANAAAFEFHRRIGNVGKPVDKDEWHMTPPTVNAYYNASNNEMVFPAGILQPPFFHRDFAKAMNFGGIGMVMGHELTHGFDDQGRKFDGSGRLTQWWDDAVVAQFEGRAECVEKLYSSYEVQPNVPLNGKLTLGENIADLGGVKEAYNAYKAWVAENGPEDQYVDELTNEQLFFVAVGQIWCGKETPEAERMLVKTDSHSRPKFRVNGPLSNFPGFWEAFACEEGTPMHPANACEVW